jgi:hypothetical protein
MKKPSFYLIAAAVLGLHLCAARAETIEANSNRCLYEQLKSGHPDGILKRYCGRQIAQIMGWEGAEWLERPERKTEEGLDKLIDLLRLKPGMKIGDIGAGICSGVTKELARQKILNFGLGIKVLTNDRKKWWDNIV